MNREERILKYINTADEFVFSGKRYYENDFYNDVEDLVKESQKLKRKLNESIHKATEFGSEVYELKKQLEEYKNELGKADSITQSCIFNGKKESEISYRKCLNMLEKHKNQQKEFIEYLENEIKRLEENDIYEPLQRMALATNQYNLSKYKEIIGDKE